MKIREIIELSKTDSLAKIAKEHLSVGKEKAREGLKQAGCYSINGVKGWHFDGDESVLEQSIYDFVTTTRKATPSPNVSSKKRKNEKTKEQTNISAEEEINKGSEQAAPTLERTKEETNVTTKERLNVVRKRASFDLDVELLKELKIKAVVEDKNIYEMVETAIRHYLKG
ncbi:hypothetical protein ABEY63_26420 [Priestia aryabhattai]|uniref:hypothetical protein n=1 Tax=Priestia aryabhattai TaxID=412384 RepID=UPI003D2C2FFD